MLSLTFCDFRIAKYLDKYGGKDKKYCLFILGLKIDFYNGSVFATYHEAISSNADTIHDCHPLCNVISSHGILICRYFSLSV